ncbi:M48 family metalloprotease [Chryseobacterium jejuense]|uniref:Heat shock protein HtpX n=1 Tax=Chryseobacterium jejuense TaxID=445960 RepID=A0A2X2V805_CHRJE|nr:M48 family metallopeptidase [Chryseobacterium jejuense]SDI37993.1 Zn-dependent protease with chaperone function [Chryseobacterium jejuense]SQB26892.1 heat shock protein HtpX [Chryseobacterium jejuense]
MTNNLPKISTAYQSKLISAIVSVSAFFVIYLLLILASLLMIFLLGYGAIKLLTIKVNYFTIFGAAGLFSIGIFVFIFLIRFIFRKNEYSTRHLIEVSRSHQPELFDMIDEIVKETKVQAPKKVFLSPDVNASVSYNSIFWSMFLPVKKNLTIGIGLINTTSAGELKTVLAHEFGHFSQRSMKVGGYVNQAEKIIFETVYNNKDYENFIMEFSGGNIFFKIFGLISVSFINAFQYILKSISNFLFKNHASLQREMEYHADAISTFVTNPDEQISSLLRLELSDAAFNYATNFYIESNQKYLPKNLYENQISLMKIFSERNNHPYVNGLPKIDIEDLTRYNKSRIEIEDQWSSHPDIDKRVERIKKNETRNTTHDHRPAGEIIKGYESICETLTAKYLTLLSIKNVGEVIDGNTFTTLYLENNRYQNLVSGFNGYYERHTPILENVETMIPDDGLHHESDLFSDKKVSLVYEKAGIEQDLQTLKYLVSQPKEIKTFRYNGTLHKAKDAGTIIPQLENELKDVTAELGENDKSIFQYYYRRGNDQYKMSLIHKYTKMTVIDKEFDEFQESLNEFIGYLQFMAVTLPFEEIRKYRAKLLKAEKPFKQKIRSLLESSAYKELLTAEENNLLQQFVNSEYIYFNNDRYLQNEVDSVSLLIEKYQGILNTYYLNTKQELLNLQSEISKAS